MEILTWIMENFDMYVVDPMIFEGMKETHNVPKMVLEKYSLYKSKRPIPFIHLGLDNLPQSKPTPWKMNPQMELEQLRASGIRVILHSLHDLFMGPKMELERVRELVVLG